MDGLARVIHHLTQATQALQAHAKAQRQPDPRLARRLAAHGRGGDTMLAHINPREAQKLKQDGGAGTINPRTGLPEFYDAGPGGSNEGGGAADGFGGSASGGGVNDAGGGNAGPMETGTAPGGFGSVGGYNGAGPPGRGGIAAGLGPAPDVGPTGGYDAGALSAAAPYSRTTLDKIISSVIAPGFTGIGSPTAVQSGIVGVGRGLMGMANPGMSLMNAIDTVTGGALSAHGDKSPATYGTMSNDIAGQSIDPAVLAAINGAGGGG